MRNNNSPKLAFSIIELAIVVAIISILISLVISANKILESSNLTVARTITSSAPVPEIDGLVLWLETTMEQSFDNLEADDGQAITTWHDLSQEYNDAAANGNPTYVADVINELPVVNFDGDDFMTLANASNLGVANSDYEFFIVYQSDSNTSQSLIMGSTQMHYEVLINNTYDVRFVPNGGESGARIADISPVNFDITSPHIISARVEVSTARIRVDGNEGITPDTVNAAVSSQTTDLWIGKRSGETDFLNGNIAEIIIYNRAVTDFERQDIEQYLSKKWGIDLS